VIAPNVNAPRIIQPARNAIARFAAIVATALWLAACTTVPRAPADMARLAAQVTATERAFARSMAQRDFTAFSSHLSADAVFFTGPQPLRGKAEVAGFWKRWFADAVAPFSWEPDHVEVLASGDLALSTGPVHTPDGRLAGRFNSIWRLEAPGTWRIVFDRGEDVCAAPAR
jgi:ketosteroid isomerase-like protein